MSDLERAMAITLGPFVFLFVIFFVFIDMYHQMGKYPEGRTIKSFVGMTVAALVVLAYLGLITLIALELCFNIEFDSTHAALASYLHYWGSFTRDDVIGRLFWIVAHIALFCIWTWWLLALIESAIRRAWWTFLYLRLQFWRWRSLRELRYLRRLNSFLRSILRGDWDDAFTYSEKQKPGSKS